MKFKTLFFIVLTGVLLMSITQCASRSSLPEYLGSSQFKQGKFHNSPEVKTGGLSGMPKILWRYMFEERIAAEPEKPIPVQKIDLRNPALADNSPALFRLGHSSILLQLSGKHWLIDPVFSDRASPFSWAGPKRFHKVPLDFDSVQEIEGVIISHDHYDHLDRETIEKLHHKIKRFYTPLGVGQHLLSWGVPESKIIELDWWQDVQAGDIKLTATPAQHFSGRGLTDGNETLWASWVIQTEQHKIFYSGDSGYFDGFKDIGERLGPFDLTLMENGAYDKQWTNVHMTPEETLQAHRDVGGKALMPVHNGTFDLALHPWYEPFERISALAKQQNVHLVTPQIGEAVNLENPDNQNTWWKL